MAKVVFCQRVVYSYFGVMTISAVLKKHGHATELVMEADPQKVIDEIIAIDPDMVMFSTVTATGDFEWGVDIATQIKQQRPQMIMAFGSTHPTLFPEETLQHAAVDIACRGEGEMAVLELCNRYDQGKDYSDIPGLWVKTAQGIFRNSTANLVEDLDQFPFPDRELYQKYKYFDRMDSIDVLAGRGCIFNCNFCMNTTSKDMMRGQGKFVRKHSPDYMMLQLKEIKQKYKPRFFVFQDELFTAKKRWVKEFCERYRAEIKTPFICSATADTIDEDIAAWLASAGAIRVCMGLETGNEYIRNHVLNKHFSNAQFIKAVETLHKYKVKVLTLNMIGLPGETIDNAFETIELNYRTRTDFLYFSIFQPYPGLRITQQLQNEGRLDAALNPTDFQTTFFITSLIKQDNIKQLINLHKFFFFAVRFPWLKPLIRQLIKLPPNWFFQQAFIFSFGWMQFRCFRRSPLQLLFMGLGNLKVFYAKRKKSVPEKAICEIGEPVPETSGVL